MYTFIPLAPGTIADLFSGKRQGKPRIVVDPLGIPVIRSQCAHVNIEELTEGYDYVRCLSDADQTARHGWLCAIHGQDRIRRVVLANRDKDQEIVDGIIATDVRLIAKSREDV